HSDGLDPYSHHFPTYIIHNPPPLRPPTAHTPFPYTTLFRSRPRRRHQRRPRERTGQNRVHRRAVVGFAQPTRQGAPLSTGVARGSGGSGLTWPSPRTGARRRRRHARTRPPDPRPTPAA